MKVLFIGDIIGKPGRVSVEKILPGLRKKYQPDLVIANAENATHGNGLQKKTYIELVEDLKIDILTSGNHIWDKKEIFKNIDSFKRLVRPANFSPGVPGQEKIIIESAGVKTGIFNLMGRVFMPPYDDPFRTADRIIQGMMREDVDNIIVDIHAEATSEKVALGWYLDGRVTAVIGTHTHVQTADERILPEGTAYITDVGHTGAYNSVIGVDKKPIIKRFLTMMPVPFDPPEEGPVQFNGVFFETDQYGKAVKIKRVFELADGE
ncbi:MAG: TIGR00282 family metallophosphoesterase [Candidatus Margulisiibacteriota bacterium]